MDIDIREHQNGEDSIIDRGIIFDKSCQIRTPSDGRHIYSKHPKQPVKNKAGNFLGPGVDFRGDGWYVIFSGSWTTDGEYAPVTGHCPFSIELEALPAEILAKLNSECEFNHNHDNRIQEGQRNNSLFHLASRLYSSG